MKTYQRYWNVSSLHVKLKYKCADCLRVRAKVIPITLMRELFGSEERNQEAQPPQTGSFDVCPFCNAQIEKSTDSPAFFCDKCGQNLKCSNCGSVVVTSGSKFCMTCGSTLIAAGQTSTESIPAGSVCPQCGSEIREGAGFCAECGQSLSCECGEPIDPAASFCGGCGRALHQDEDLQ